MTTAVIVIILAGLLLVMGRALVVQTREIQDCDAEITGLLSELSDARSRAEGLYAGGRRDGARTARDIIVDALSVLPRLACGTDPHLRLSEVLAAVRGEPVVAKWRKPAVRVGQSANGIAPDMAPFAELPETLPTTAEGEE